MPYETISSGLTLVIPTSGTTNYAASLKANTWQKISEHQHTGSGDGLQMVTASYADNTITTIKLSKNIGVTQASVLTPTGTTETLDWDEGNVQRLNLGSATGDVTLTLSNPGTGHLYRVYVTQGATARNLTWPAAVLWPQGVAPILSTGNTDVDCITLHYNGTNYLGEWEVDYA